MKLAIAITAVLAVTSAQPAAADNQEWIPVPSLTGLTVDEAAAKLRAAGLRPEGGTRLQARGTSFAPGPTGPVTSQSIKAGTRVEPGARVIVGTTGRQIDFEGWNRVGFEHGRIVLGDLSRACVRYDHATIGAPRNGARTITLWGERVKGCQAARRLELQPPSGWTIDTNAVPTVAPGRMDPTLTGDTRRAPRLGAILMPNRRSVLVRFSRDACHGVAAASATMRGRAITTRVTLGTRPDHKRVCIARRDVDSVLIALPRPAPLGVTFR
ncbi:PASTA domain-containing protein [Solirubrobacter taibaiensis]|nr:PASTA domain-containing protein [Solirubrobacter taibaiensis]